MNSIVSAMDRMGQIRSRFDSYFARQTQTNQAESTRRSTALNTPIPEISSNQTSIEQSQLLRAQSISGVTGIGRVLDRANNSLQGTGLLNPVNPAPLLGRSGGSLNSPDSLGSFGSLESGNRSINAELEIGGGSEWTRLGEVSNRGVSFQQLLAERLKVGTESAEKINQAAIRTDLSSPTRPVTPVVKTVGNEFPYQKEITAAAEQYKLPVALVRSVVAAESGFNPLATSEKGAMGLMQLMPQTAEALGISDAYDIKANLEGGTRYLRMLLNRYEGDYTKALSAYNAGGSAVDRTLEKTGLSVPPYKETNLYIKKILNNYMKYSGVRS